MASSRSSRSWISRAVPIRFKAHLTRTPWESRGRRQSIDFVDTPISLQPAGIGTSSGSGTDFSGDGQCAVGYQDAGFFTPHHAFRWTAAGGPVDLGTLVPASNSTLSSFAWGTSLDCSVIAGFSDMAGSFTQHAFRWTQAGGMVDLVPPGGAAKNSRAFGLSSDGLVLVGDADFVDNGTIEVASGAGRFVGHPAVDSRRWGASRRSSRRSRLPRPRTAG